jgi:hypothetical protein
VVTVAWARTRGADIVATRPGTRLVLEAKGEVLLQPQQVSGWFVFMRAEAGALGESRTWVYATGLFGFTLLITFALRQRPPE